MRKDLDVFISISRILKQNELIRFDDNFLERKTTVKLRFDSKLRYQNICIPCQEEFNQWHRRIAGWWRESLINIFKQCMLYVYTCWL